MRYLSYSLLVSTAILVSGCSTLLKPAVFSADDCQVLAEKRNVKKTRKQPKVKSYPHFSQSDVVSIMKPVDSAQEVIPVDFPETEPVFYASSEPVLFIPEDDQLEKAIPFSSPDHQETEVTQSTPLPIASSRPAVQNELLSNLPVAGIFGGTALASILLLSLFKRSTLRLSTWAARNPITTRYLFAGIHTATIAGAYTAGSIALSDGYSLHGGFLAGAMTATAVAAITYPGKQTGHSRSSWFKRKCYDALLYTAGTSMVFYLGNQQPQLSIRSLEPVSYSMLVNKQSLEEVIEKKMTRTGDDQSIKAEPKKRNVGLKILAVVGFIALTFAVSAISCSIACSGSEALALIVFVGLETLLVGLLIRIFKRLSGKTKKKTPETVTEDYKYPAAL